MRRHFFLACLALLATCSMAQQSWMRVKIQTPSVTELERLNNSDLNIMDCVPHLGWNDVVVEPGGYAKLMALGLNFLVLGPIESPLNYEETHGIVPQADYRLNYLNADQILAYYEGLRTANPKFVTRRQIGNSINGEAMWVYRFGRAVNKGIAGAPDPTQNILSLQLIHAREWISGSVGMHIATKVLSSLKTNPTFMANQALWVVPIHNPDGYRYTWATNRLWRKNRRLNSDGSYGVDLNRNYSKGWGLNGGSSSTRSSETYRGTAAFSEPETQAVRNLVLTLPKVAGMIDYHSYSQLVLWPWGYTSATPPDSNMLNTVCQGVRDDMSTNGATYTQGQTSIILYIASGTSNDYVYDRFHTADIAIELRDTGTFGFELPENQITPCQDEAWTGFQRFLTYLSH